MKTETQKRTATRQSVPDGPLDFIGRLRHLVQQAWEKRIDANVGHGERLVFKNEGLRIYRKADGSYRVVEKAGYCGPQPEAYVEMLGERELEKESLARIETMTDEERAALLDEVEGIEMVLRQREAE